MFSKSEPNERVLVFHIGSGTVSGAYVEFDKQNGSRVPRILSVRTKEVLITSKLEFPSLLNGMQKALSIVSEELVETKLGKPSKIICFLGSPWYATQTRTLRTSKNASFVVTKKLVEDLVKKEVEFFEKEELLKWKGSGDEAVLVEREIHKFLLNGYAVSDPYESKAKELEISLVLSIAPATVLESVRKSIENSFHTREIIFHSFLYAGTLVLSDLFISHDNFLLVDIGSEVTDIALIKGNTLSDSISFPSGSNTILREFAEHIRTPVSDILPLLSLYNDGKLESSIALRTEKALTPLLDKWTSAFQSALSTLATEFLVPDTIAVTTRELMLPMFKKAIAKESFSQYTLSEKPFTIIPITNQSLESFVHEDHVVYMNPFTTIEALAAAKKYF